MSEAIPGPVRAVTFDLDYTLWDLTGVIELAEERTDEWLRRYYPDVARRYDRAALRELRLAIAERQPALAHDVTALRQEGLRQAGVDCGYAGDELKGLVIGAFEAFIEGRHEVRLYPDTLPFLEWLRRRLPLGAITNGNADVQRLSLGAYFDFTVSAMEIGASKPSHLVFEAAASRAGVPAGSIVHVGDDCECDVLGAAAFGMQPIWITRDDHPWPDALTVPEHVRVTDLDRLADLLRPHLDHAAGREAR
jgi:putative hydrolase of the HAD superfamily